MHRLAHPIALLLALATLTEGVASLGATGQALTVVATSAAASHHDRGGDHQGCHQPSVPERMPCDGHAPDCPLMIGCSSLGPVGVVLAIAYDPPRGEPLFPPRDLHHAQFAPVPESPPPRA